MKISAAMLKGYAKVGRQCVGQMYEGDSPKRPEAVCAAGAALLGRHGTACYPCGDWEDAALVAADDAFDLEFGCRIQDANDDGRMPIDVIAGLLRAIGH